MPSTPMQWTPITSDDPRLHPLTALSRRGAGAAISPLLVEGEVALRRALAAGHRPTLVVATPACAARLGQPRPGTTALVLEPDDFSTVVGFEFHRGCIGVVPRPVQAEDAWDRAVADLLARPRARIVALDRVADAENVGAVIRSARALGVDLVVLGRGCADPLSRRAVRTSVGQCFAQPLLVDVDLAAVLRAAPAGLAWWSTGAWGPDEAVRPWTPMGSVPHHLAVVLGNEGDGVAHDVAARCSRHLRLAVNQDAESLNVAATAAILTWSLAAAPERG